MTRRKKYVHNKKFQQSRHYASAGVGLGLGMLMSLVPLSAAYAKRLPVPFVGPNRKATKKQTSSPTSSTTPTTQTGSGSAVPTAQTNTQQSVPTTTVDKPAATELPAIDGPCSNTTITASSYNGSHAVLRKVAEYRQICTANVPASAMVFSSIPTTSAEALEIAADLQTTFRLFAAYGVEPLVIFEPTASGSKLDISSLTNAAYVQAFTAMVQQLKNAGLTDNQLGVWVLFPEPNLPEWSSVNPSYFVANINAFGLAAKQAAPDIKLSILLDSTTYTVNNYNEAGKRVSLLPYVTGIQPGLLYSFGMQGFPWAAPANTTYASSFEPTAFLPTSLAVEAAQALGVSNAWFNTGTFATFYAQSTAKKVTLSASQRAVMLDGIAKQANAMTAKGYTMRVNIFAENKSATAEGVDWSYWSGGLSVGSAKTNEMLALSRFVNQLQQSNIQFGVFDSY